MPWQLLDQDSSEGRCMVKLKADWSTTNKEIYERESSWGFRDPDHFYERFYRQMIRDFFGLSPSFKILDLGCGDGFYLQWFAREANAFGQDIASAYIEQQLGPVLMQQFKSGDASTIQFPGGFFDGVFLNHVIEHVDKDSTDAVIQEIHRVLKPGGKLFVATPNRFSLAELFLDVTFQGGRRIETGHANIMTPTTLRALLERNGFHIQRLCSRSVLFFPSGLNLPIIGRYMTGYPALVLLSRTSARAAVAMMNFDLYLSSKEPFRKLGFDVIALCRKKG